MQNCAVLFDLDDTLVVEYASAQQSVLTVCKTAEGCGAVPDQLMGSVFKRARELFHKLPTYEYCMKIGISSWEGLWANFQGENKNLKQLRSLKEEYQTNSWYLALLDSGIDSKRLARELSHQFCLERRKRHILLDHAFEVLTGLSQNYKLGLITNGASDLQMEKIKGAGIERFFDHIIISGDIGIGKPEKEIFLAAFEKFNFNKDRYIMVGDSIRTDISGACNVGIKAVWLNDNNKKMENGIAPSATIHNLNQLPQEINRLFCN